jgi:hypothetical protein
VGPGTDDGIGPPRRRASAGAERARVSRGRASTVVATLSACCACAAATSAVAQTETNASMRPSLLPDRLGASSALTLAFRFAGGAEGVPAPLRGMVVHLPAGLTVSLRGVKTCAKSRLQRRGPSGCPAGSLVGRGQALMKVHAGSQAVPEEAAISIFRSPSGSGRPTFEIYGHGETPLDQSSISTAVLQPDAAPYGLKVSVSVPPIPTLVLEPDASVVSLSPPGHTPPPARSACRAAVPPKGFRSPPTSRSPTGPPRARPPRSPVRSRVAHCGGSRKR